MNEMKEEKKKRKSNLIVSSHLAPPQIRDNRLYMYYICFFFKFFFLWFKKVEEKRRKRGKHNSGTGGEWLYFRILKKKKKQKGISWTWPSRLFEWATYNLYNSTKMRRSFFFCIKWVKSKKIRVRNIFFLHWRKWRLNILYKDKKNACERILKNEVIFDYPWHFRIMKRMVKKQLLNKFK